MPTATLPSPPTRPSTSSTPTTASTPTTPSAELRLATRSARGNGTSNPASGAAGRGGRQARFPRTLDDWQVDDSRDQRERRRMTWPHDGEVAMIKRCDHVGMMPLCERDHGGVHHPEWEVEILLGEAGDPFPLRVKDWLDHELSVGDRAAERQFRMGADPVCQQIADLGHDQSGNEEWSLGGGEQVDTTKV